MESTIQVGNVSLIKHPPPPRIITINDLHILSGSKFAFDNGGISIGNYGDTFYIQVRNTTTSILGAQIWYTDWLNSSYVVHNHQLSPNEESTPTNLPASSLNGEFLQYTCVMRKTVDITVEEVIVPYKMFETTLFCKKLSEGGLGVSGVIKIFET